MTVQSVSSSTKVSSYAPTHVKPVPFTAPLSMVAATSADEPASLVRLKKPESTEARIDDVDDEKFPIAAPGPPELVAVTFVIDGDDELLYTP